VEKSVCVGEDKICMLGERRRCGEQRKATQQPQLLQVVDRATRAIH
jgi:hypothetical protein